MTRAELLKQAAECEARIGKLSTLADKLAKARDILDDDPARLSLAGASVDSNVIVAHHRVSGAIASIEATIKGLRAEQARLIEEAGRVESCAAEVLKARRGEA